MIQLDSSLHSFDPSNFGTIRDLLDKEQAKPRDALMFACSDHGCAPDNVSFAEPDRFCILQHIGSSIPSTQQCAEIEELNVDDISHLFENFPIRHAVVCGHLDCDVIPNWLNEPPESPDYCGKFRSRFFEQTVQLVDHAYPEISSDTRTKLMIYEHVLIQVANLLTHDFIQQLVLAEKLKMHAWVADDVTARVQIFNPASGQFEV